MAVLKFLKMMVGINKKTNKKTLLPLGTRLALPFTDDVHPILGLSCRVL